MTAQNLSLRARYVWNGYAVVFLHSTEKPDMAVWGLTAYDALCDVCPLFLSPQTLSAAEQNMSDRTKPSALIR